MSDALLSTLKLLAIGISFGGYAVFIFHRFKIRSEILPAVVCSFVGVVLFISGILNILPFGAHFIYFGGLVFLGFTFIKYKVKINNIHKFFSFGMIFFILLCGYFVLYLRSAHLYAYDDFTHWGVIVKELQLYGRLPNASSQAITFPTYPPASALFIYYVTTFVGTGENIALMAQMFLTSAFASALFIFVPRGIKGIVPNLIASVSVLFLIGLFQQATSTLLVDALFPLSAVANTAIIIYYRKHLVTASVLSFFLMTFTILIKNSGLFFALVNAGLLLFFVFEYYRLKTGNQKTRNAIVIIGVISIVASFAMLFVWKLHVSMVFPPEAKLGHHSMDISNYKSNFASKPQEQVDEITNLFIKHAGNPKTRANLVMGTLSVFLGLLALAFRFGFKKKLNATIYALFFCNVLYVLYIVGIYFMHLFSMPPEEASSFVSFNRYAISCVIYCGGIFTIGILYDIKKRLITNETLLSLFSISALAIVLYMTSFGGTVKSLTGRPDYFKTHVYEYDKAIANTEINPDNSYLLYRPKSAKDVGFGAYLSKYKLFTKNFKILTEIQSKEELLQQIEQYDHFVVIEQDEAIMPYLSEQK